MSQFNVSGMMSGVDTASLINSLVSIQQNQQTLLKTQQSQQQKAADTYAKLISSLGDLSGLASSLAKTSDWKGASATSSSSSVTATAIGTQAAALSFDVTSLARAHSLVSHESVASLNTQVAAGPLTFTKADGSQLQVQTGTGSLADVVAAVNASSAGVTASAVQTSPGQFRLQLTAGATGAASAFSVTGLTGFTGTDVLSQGSDARITVGSNPATAYSVSSTTNTFSGVVPGLSFSVSRLETGVTVTSAIDGSSVADDVKKLVDAANTVLSNVETATQWNATTKTGGSLVGDSAARTLQQSVLSLVGTSGAPGITLTRGGRLSFDRDTFTKAFAADPKGVAAKYGANGVFTPTAGVTGSVTFAASTSATKSGSYAITVTGLAAAEQWTAPAAGGFTAGQVVSLTRGSTVASYTVGAGDDLAKVATELTKAATAAGLGVSASASGTDLRVTADAAGSAGAFTLAVDGTQQTHTTVGTDVAGTIGGQTAVGKGSTLSLAFGSGDAKGLEVTVALSQADLTASGGAVGSIGYTPGLAQRVVQLVDKETAADTGVLATAKSGRESAVKALQTQIDDWDRRLTAYRASLQAQFTAMETTLAALKSQSNFLSSYNTTQSSSSSTSSG